MIYANADTDVKIYANHELPMQLPRTLPDKNIQLTYIFLWVRTVLYVCENAKLWRQCWAKHTTRDAVLSCWIKTLMKNSKWRENQIKSELNSYNSYICFI